MKFATGYGKNSFNAHIIHVFNISFILNHYSLYCWSETTKETAIQFQMLQHNLLFQRLILVYFFLEKKMEIGILLKLNTLCDFMYLNKSCLSFFFKTTVKIKCLSEKSTVFTSEMKNGRQYI